jgi:ketosteroid isomerase-like protein
VDPSSDTARENADIARRLWAAASQGDTDPLLVFHPKIVWKTWGHGPNAGECHGLEQVFEYLARSNDAVEDMRSELIDILSSERGAVILYRMIVTRGSRRLDTRFSLWLTIEDGVVVRADAVPFEDEANDAFWRVD